MESCSFLLHTWELRSLPGLYHSWCGRMPLNGGKAWGCFLKEHLGRRAWAEA